MIRKAQAIWNGDLKEGHGAITTDSKTLDATQYSFKTRFEDGVGTNPEELIAAAHAGCFSMALSLMLGNQGITAESITTTSAVSLEQVDGGFAITKAHLTTHIVAPGADGDKIMEAAEMAEKGCPVSKVLNAEISLEATYDV